MDELHDRFSDFVEDLTPKKVFFIILAVEVIIVCLFWDDDTSTQTIAAKIAIGSFVYWTIARFSRRLITATRHWHPLARSIPGNVKFDETKDILIGKKERRKLKGVFDSIQNLIPDFHTKHKHFFDNVLEEENIKGALGLKLHNLIHNAEEQVLSSSHLSPKRKLRGTRFLRCARMYLFVGVVSGYKRDRLPIFHYLLGIPTLYDQEEEDCL